MPRIQLHDPMKGVIEQESLFHAMFAQALRQNKISWIQRIRNWIGL